MIPFTQNLLAEVEEYLAEVRDNNFDIITSSKKNFVKLKESCDKVTQQLHHYNFHNLEEEIQFFKEVKPLLFSRLIYNKYIYKLEVSKPLIPEEIKAYLIKHLNKIAKFFEQHEELSNYISNRDCSFDDKYFTKCKSLNNSVSLLKHEELELTRFSSHGISVARIIAYKQVEEYIIEELRKSVGDSFVPMSDSNKWKKLKGLKLQWTAPQIDLIELIYGLHRRKCINNGDIEIKALVEAAEILFGITIKDVYRIYSDIKSRLHRTKFLDSLRDSLDKSIEEEDS